MHPIQMVDLKRQYHKIKKEVDEAVLNVIESTAFINGKPVQEFAKIFLLISGLLLFLAPMEQMHFRLP
jgi:dTDP-4-amino-4,6-dideoxygalactose transaminase